jgi:hypothetical protein
MAAYERAAGRTWMLVGSLREGRPRNLAQPITDRNFTVDGKIKSRHTANAVMKQAGINHHF